MLNFENAYKLLNKHQKNAVDSIDGPLLVVAGPGTGKTHLLILRIANILLKTDVSPSNILCLTFSESAANELRQRLIETIGKAAYEVKISTYHGYGSEVIQNNPQHFPELALARPIDDIDSNDLIVTLLSKLEYNNPLRAYISFPKEIQSSISDMKDSLISPVKLKKIAKDNLNFVNETSKNTRKNLEKVIRVDKKSFEYFEKLLSDASDGELAAFFYSELAEALEDRSNTKLLTKWKNKWLEKDNNAKYIVKGRYQNERLIALSKVYDDYQKELRKKGLYDYDDMIQLLVNALQNNDDLKYSLQEQSQYIMLDEFQDTNISQLEIVRLLGDNPVLEEKPNIMAVGDDDQAIYTFQGADYSHMLKFSKFYPSTKVIALQDNYRSFQEIINLSGQVSDQIETKLTSFLHIDKSFKSHHGSGANIEGNVYDNDAAEYNDVAKQIQKLIKNGEKADQIGLIAPKHKYLEEITHYLKHKDIPVNYERREDILEKPIIIELFDSLRLVQALSTRQFDMADSILPKVLSQDHYGFDVKSIWKFAWETKADHKHWSEKIIDSKQFSEVALFFIELSNRSNTIPIENIVEALIGREEVNGYTNPFFKYHKEKQTDFVNVISDLSLLRSKAKDRAISGNQVIYVNDFLDVVEKYQSAGIKLMNTNRFVNGTNGVEVLTVHKSKGKEYKHVFLINMVDEIWGSSQRSFSSKISLPENLKHINNNSNSDDEYLRLLYVAMTRAKTNLRVSSHRSTITGKKVNPVKYLDGLLESKDGKSELVEFSDVEPYWFQKHSNEIKNLGALLKPKLENYRLSPSHLNKFIDVVYSGPQSFFIENILGFPTPSSADMIYGNVIHGCLEWIHITLSETGKLPSENLLLKRFYQQLERQQLTKEQFKLLKKRGEVCLKAVLSKRSSTFHEDNKHEENFYNDGITLGEAVLTGKIDKLIINKQGKTITIVDYKTGRSEDKWKSSIKLHKYKQQLYIYKYLVEQSHRFAGYKVDKAYLEFVDPDTDGIINTLELEFDNKTEENILKLIKIVWAKIQKLEFADISQFPQNMTGVIKFEKELIEGE
ncbi:MAG: ATP-dependent helicase [bacterium]|nr:ATP-dependent helicase [bacterium]